MQKHNIYYEIVRDLEAYPDAWAYLIIGGRNTGKTYGTLEYFREEKLPIVFIKRSNEDIDTICAGNSLGKKAAEYEVDLSPYKAINRDKGCHIKAYKIKNGLGGFYETNEEGNAYGQPISYGVSLYAVNKIKGFDLSECSALVFDEFIPQPWERINRKEGEQLMDLYKTVARDRTLRGKEELKLICLANAVNVFNPVCEILEVTDIISEMAARKTETYFDREKRIFIRMLRTSDEMMAAEKATGIYKAMEHTNWGKMAFENEFGYNDFSQIKSQPLKGYRPICSLTHKLKTWYIYLNEEKGYFMTDSPAKVPLQYDLNTESGQKAFYVEQCLDLQEATIGKRMWYKKYTMYDTIMNYRKRFIV